MTDAPKAPRKTPGYTIPSLAKFLELSEASVRRAIRDGDIKTVKFAGRVRITPTEAERIRKLLFEIQPVEKPAVEQWSMSGRLMPGFPTAT